MIKENRYCDLCDEPILGVGDNRMVIFEHSYQDWDGKDVCGQCCIILHNAKEFGLIEYDTAQFFDDRFYKTTSVEVKEDDTNLRPD